MRSQGAYLTNEIRLFRVVGLGSRAGEVVLEDCYRPDAGVELWAVQAVRDEMRLVRPSA